MRAEFLAESSFFESRCSYQCYSVTSEGRASREREVVNELVKYDEDTGKP